MKRSSTAAIDRIQIFKEHQLTIGLDIGDRTSHCCILNEAGEVILESKLSTMAKGTEEVFSGIRRSRIALETGTNSPLSYPAVDSVGPRSDCGPTALRATDRRV